MCGITGIITFSSEYKSDDLYSIIKRQTSFLKHRGPDSEGIFVNDGLALGHRRLSIIDLNETSNQPLHDESKRYTIVFNGEIYNYNEIKSSIKDYSWQTFSDTEVILASYIKWGEKCLEKLNGMFAFAIWDSVLKELFIARDRLGVKPLYYFLKSNILIFSSEIKSITASNLVEKKINFNSVIDVLQTQSVRTPNSIIDNINQIPPGYFAKFNNNGFELQCYWKIDNLNLSPYKLSLNETILKTKELVSDSIKSRMVSDVQVGAFLSGGIDSSIVVSEMAKHTHLPIKTFSITFNHVDFNESKYSRFISQKYSTKHEEFLLEPISLIDEIPDFFQSMDTPTVDGINTYIISKIVAKTGIKVVLSGIGGDELFAGYSGFNRYKNFTLFPFNSLHKILKLKIPNHNRTFNKIRSFLTQEELTLNEFYKINRAIYLHDETDKICNFTKPNPLWINLNSKSIKSYPILSQYSIAELTNYSLDVLLKDTDQMSMASSLEIREPFFDYKLIEFILQVPDKFKYSAQTPKSLLVKSFNDLPNEIVYRQKKGFSFPWDSWIRSSLKDFCGDNLSDLSKRDIFIKKGIFDIWKDFHYKRNGISWLHIWSLVCVESYLRTNKL